MADSYMLFSEGLNDLTEEELAWCEEELQRRSDLEPDAEPEYPDFEWQIHKPKHPDDGRWIIMYSEEAGSVDAVIDFVQAFLQKFRPDEGFQISWALTCSKARPGQFGGGAAFVTANTVQAMRTFDWCGDRQREHKESKDGPR